MLSRKRPIRAVNGDVGVPSRDNDSTLLSRIRNMWQFANFCQWIYIFGKTAKIDDAIDIEVIEAECLKPDSPLLADLALSILKLVSSHRGLTHDIFDDQLRKQYSTKASNSNPLGCDGEPRKFAELDVFSKIMVLQQLTQWTMVHPERIRDQMEEQRDVEQTSWRIEPYGWDREDRIYYVLDDKRVYRVTEAPPEKVQPKPKGKAVRAGRRYSKLQGSRINQEKDNGSASDSQDGGAWECVAVTLQEVQELLANLGRTRDENEKTLRRQLEAHLVPILEKQEESQKRKQLQRERDLLNLAKMANAKRSSRIAGKVEKQRQDKAREEQEQLRAAEMSRLREEQVRLKMEQERDFRTFSRQRRLQEREARRIQHEEELVQLSEDSRTASATAGRFSERRRQAEIERNRQALKKLSQEGKEWVFDCICGLFGQVDGTHSVACERCSVWLHSKCLGISEAEADRPDFQFICEPCQRRILATSMPRKDGINIDLDTTICSITHPQTTEQPHARQSPRPAMAGDGTSGELNRRPCFESAAPLSVDTPLSSTFESRQSGLPSSIDPPNSIDKPLDRFGPEPLSRPRNEESATEKIAARVEKHDIFSTIVVRNEETSGLDSTKNSRWTRR